MALEALKGVTEIGGFKVATPDDFVEDCPVWITGENIISFKLQDGPIKEVGVNGCQIDTLIHAAKVILEGLNKKFPCRENENALEHLDSALDALEARTRNRVARNVEGISKA